MMGKRVTVYESVIRKIILEEQLEFLKQYSHFFGVPSGGGVLVHEIVSALNKRGAEAQITYDPGDADLIVDDIIDSGKTVWKYREECPENAFFALFSKIPLGNLPEMVFYARDCDRKTWITFPWEKETGAEDVPLRLLQYIGEDPKREGLQRTPERFLKAWKFWTSGYNENPEDILVTFEDGKEGYDEMITLGNFAIYSTCEHHLSPFFGEGTIAYIPGDKIVGISKLFRVAEIFSRRLQVQERLTTQIAECLNRILEPMGVGVILRCRHLCMESRGIQQSGAITTTSALKGIFLTDERVRNEFLSFYGGG